MCHSTETSPSLFQKENISCFCNRRPGSRHDIPAGITTVFSTAGLSCDLVIQLQGRATGTGNHQINPKNYKLSTVTNCRIQLMLCGSGALLRVIVELSLSSPMAIFMFPRVMLCPALPSLRQGQNSLHSCSFSVLPIPCLYFRSPARCGYPVFLKETFFSSFPCSQLNLRAVALT